MAKISDAATPIGQPGNLAPTESSSLDGMGFEGLAAANGTAVDHAQEPIPLADPDTAGLPPITRGRWPAVTTG